MKVNNLKSNYSFWIKSLENPKGSKFSSGPGSRINFKNPKFTWRIYTNCLSELSIFRRNLILKMCPKILPCANYFLMASFYMTFWPITRVANFNWEQGTEWVLKILNSYEESIQTASVKLVYSEEIWFLKCIKKSNLTPIFFWWDRFTWLSGPLPG